MADEELIQAQTTVPSREDGVQIGQAVVDAGLAACAQLVGPIESRYRWRGAATVSEEWVLLLKARRADWDALVVEVTRLHPYEVPELIALPVLEATRAYGEWVIAETVRDRD